MSNTPLPAEEQVQPSLPQQLREQSTYMFPKAADRLMEQAAAEIEKLTAERDQYKQIAELNSETIRLMHAHARESIRKNLREADQASDKHHPDYGTPNWCSKCSPKGIGYCRCEVASNE